MPQSSDFATDTLLWQWILYITDLSLKNEWYGKHAKQYAGRP